MMLNLKLISIFFYFSDKKKATYQKIFSYSVGIKSRCQAKSVEDRERENSGGGGCVSLNRLSISE